MMEEDDKGFGVITWDILYGDEVFIIVKTSPNAANLSYAGARVVSGYWASKVAALEECARLKAQTPTCGFFVAGLDRNTIPGHENEKSEWVTRALAHGRRAHGRGLAKLNRW